MRENVKVHDNELIQTAIHEAAHAVIGRAMLQVCGGASIVTDEDSAGQAFCADPYRTQWEWDQRGKHRSFSSVLVGRIITFMAGAEAEREILGDCRGGDGDDRLQIAYMLEEYMGVVPAHEPRLRAFTRQLVRRHRAAIEAVAGALLDKGQIDVDGLDAMFPGGPPLWRLKYQETIFEFELDMVADDGSVSTEKRLASHQCIEFPGSAGLGWMSSYDMVRAEGLRPCSFDHSRLQ